MRLSESQLQSMRSSRELLQRELESAGVKFRGKACRCPFHDDHTPSAWIQEKDGVWRFLCAPCNICADIFDVRARLNRSTIDQELASEAQRQNPETVQQAPRFPNLEAIAAKFPKVEAVYKYTNPATGALEMAVIRWIRPESGKKAFTQASPAPGGQWWMKAPDNRPIYNRGRIAKVEMVVVVEGEKCVHALHDIGIVATTSPQGASSPHLADWSPLAGKNVRLWQDNDASGTTYIEAVQKKLLLNDPPTILAMVDHASLELGEGGDVADYIERYRKAGWTVEEIREAVQDVLDDAKPVGIVGDYNRSIEAVISGKRRMILFGPHRRLTNASRALMPGTVTCLFGPAGSTKSMFITECLVAWNEWGNKACAYMLEDDRDFHLRRAHAQLAGNSNITDNDWVEQNPQEMRQFVERYAKELDEIGRSIWDAPDTEITYDMMETWVEERAKAGFEIIIIDPVTAIQSKGKVWIEDQKFIFRVKTIARKYNSRVILITHPRKSGQKPVMVGLDDMAGGAAYQRFSHTVLLIERNDDEKEMTIRTEVEYPAEIATPNRIVRITKARNGPHAGRRIAFQFEGSTLRFKELGVVEKSVNS